MPRGPAVGRVEAQRRALTMPSTAPASSARWWKVRNCARHCDISSTKSMTHISPFCRAIHRPVVPVNPDARTRPWAGALLLYNLHAKAAATDTTNDGVNDPVSTAWGHSKGRTPGSFTPSLVHRL